MKATDLPDIRQAAKQKNIVYTGHAFDKMQNRGIKTSDVESILASDTNQLVEIQSASNTPGKHHRNERDLIYDPCHCPDAIIVIVVSCQLPLEITVITVEHPDDNIWEKRIGANPGLVRKS